VVSIAIPRAVGGPDSKDLIDIHAFIDQFFTQSCFAASIFKKLRPHPLAAASRQRKSVPINTATALVRELRVLAGARSLLLSLTSQLSR